MRMALISSHDQQHDQCCTIRQLTSYRYTVLVISALCKCALCASKSQSITMSSLPVIQLECLLQLAQYKRRIQLWWWLPQKWTMFLDCDTPQNQESRSWTIYEYLFFNIRKLQTNLFLYRHYFLIRFWIN